MEMVLRYLSFLSLILVPLAPVEAGWTKTEPTALAAGGLGTLVPSLGPEASAYGSQDPTFSSDQVRAAQEEKTLKVFILAGQSNLQGQAVADLKGRDYNEGRGTLEALLGDPEKGKIAKHLRAADGKWSVGEDVWCRYKREREPLLLGALTVGFSVYGEHHFGPELQFGHVLGDFFCQQKHPVLLIKTAWGGKSLYQDFHVAVELVWRFRTSQAAS